MKGRPLRHPYGGWLGYKQKHADGRRRMFMYNPLSGKRRSITLARYRMSVMLGRKLRKDEEVDHKDDDFTNDRRSNLQILTPAQNRRKEHLRRRGFLWIETPQYCVICNDKFFRYREQKTCGDRDCRNQCTALSLSK